LSSRWAPKGETRLLGFVCSAMRNFFVAPWLAPSSRTVLSIVAVAILVFSIFALLKISSGGKQEPVKELLTGSIQQSPAVRKPRTDDAMASFLAPSAFQPSPQPVQSAVVVRGPVPLPRPRSGHPLVR
jgi:hypothetical protein